MKKRYNKDIGDKRRWLKKGARLKAGDIIYTDDGVNSEVRFVTERKNYFRKNGKRIWYVYDYDVCVKHTGFHSWVHCCDDAWPKEWLLEYFKSGQVKASYTKHRTEESLDLFSLIYRTIRNGEDPYNEDGTLADLFILRYFFDKTKRCVGSDHCQPYKYKP